MAKYDFDAIRHKLSKYIDESRMTHTLGVMYTAAALAMHYAPEGAEDELLGQAMIAGLLHDNAKCMSDAQMLEKALKHSIDVTESERDNPFLLHGKLGAYYAAHRYGVEDEAVLSAITWHTTGRPDMTLLEKIVFTADYMEPGRTKQPNLAYIRRLAFEDLDKCVYVISDDTLNYLKGKKKCIDEMTVKTRDFYKDR